MLDESHPIRESLDVSPSGHLEEMIRIGHVVAPPMIQTSSPILHVQSDLPTIARRIKSPLLWGPGGLERVTSIMPSPEIATAL